MDNIIDKLIRKLKSNHFKTIDSKDLSGENPLYEIKKNYNKKQKVKSFICASIFIGAVYVASNYFLNDYNNQKTENSTEITYQTNNVCKN